MSHPFAASTGFLLALLMSPVIFAQDPGDTRPVVGLRENRPDVIFLHNARVVVEPGKVLENASVEIAGSSIVAVGQSLTPTPGAESVDCAGKTIYAGLIDGYGEIEVADPPTSDAKHWNGNILPRRAASTALRSLDNAAAWRAQGVTLRLIAPKGAIVKGTSCLVLSDSDRRDALLADDVAQHLQLTVPRDRRRDEYPNSPMGAIALLRQTLSDAEWYTAAWAAYQADSSLPRPTRNDDLERIAEDRSDGRFIIDAPNERMVLRADTIASEFSLDVLIRGSGREYRDVQGIARTGRPLLIPVDFPDAPNVDSEAAADDVSLRELMHWHFAPENPRHLAEAGIRFALTSDGLDDPKSFLKQVRVAVKRGLAADTALAALTTQPAEWFGVDDVVGRVRSGNLANLLITDGDLFDGDTNVLETWVSGKRFRHDAADDSKPDPLVGSWKTGIKVGGKTLSVRLSLEREKQKWSGTLTSGASEKTASSKPKAVKAKKDEASKKKGEEDQRAPYAKLSEIARAVDRLTAWVDLSEADERLPDGPARLTIVTAGTSESTVVFSTLTLPDGETMRIDWREDDSQPAESENVESDNTENETDEKEGGEVEADAESSSLREIVVNHPLGGYGVTQAVPTSDAVLFRGATVWTCGDQGVIEGGDVLIVDGKINAVGKSLAAPKGCKIIDCKGKHITPGLIDCHSHMATDGGVNESGQAVTAEVRVGDFVDNSDINIYRQLAGGLTIANILHGSANPIGGQNQVIKLRWGDSMRDMKMASAPQGIKFALGENVKRSNRTEPQTRYPASRMGVEQLFRDRFLAAAEYDRSWQRWRRGNQNGLPPRRDLELEALAEILRGERWIHCHSYRQDEIVALLDLLDTFGVTIGTLQHILEGYKVADRMAEHGAMASAFSDWWAYKFEVYDAIPDNGAIMHEQGIVVSFNSDDRELARHLNTEAAKAVKYGGVSAEEALKFVTLNPAKQLRIDDRVGSVDVGKDADLVVWSGRPLSTLTRCEQTWVDGRMMFSTEQDQAIRERDRRWRALLIANILDKDSVRSSGKDEEVDEEDRWLRYDEFCHGHDHDEDDHRHLHIGHDHAEVRR